MIDRRMERAHPDWQFRSRLRIKHFMLLAELGIGSSLQRAARRLHMTQPAASKLLRDAERVFGHKLFQRSGRGIAITAAGAVAVRRANLLLRDFEGAQQELDVLTDSVTGQVKVGAYMVAVADLLPLTILTLQRNHPGIIVSIEEGTSTWLLSALRRGEFDCVIGRIPENVPADIEAIPLYDEPPVVICAKGHVLARAQRLAPVHLKPFGWVLPPQNHPLRQGLEALFAVKGLSRPRMVLETDSLVLKLVVLQRTDALALLPLRLARYLASTQPISILPVELGRSYAAVATMLRRGVERSPVLAVFLDTLQSVADQMKSEGANRPNVRVRANSAKPTRKNR